MTPLLLLSSCFIALLGLAMLGLARMEPSHLHIRDWGLAQLSLAATLTLGVALLPTDAQSLHFQLQATVATVFMIATMAFEVAGAAHYNGRPWAWRRWLPLFALLLVVMMGTAVVHQPTAIWIASVALACSAWLAGWWMWQAGRSAERFVGGCFAVSGLLHFVSPLEDPLAHAAFAHMAGTCVQGLLAMSLILLSVRRAKADAARATARLRQLAEQSLQGQVVLRGDQLLYANPAALKMFGVAEPRSADGGLELLRLPGQAEEAALRHRRVIAERLQGLAWEGLRRRPDGALVHLDCLSSHIDWEDGPAELVLLLDDTERHEAREKLRRQALHDELTDLPNRHAAMEELALRTRADAPGFALLSADLDRFQLVNESLGHDVGDALLQAVGKRLREALPPGALLARLGEDQFLLLQPGVEQQADALLAGQRLLALLNAPFTVGHRQLYVHMSVGVARFPAHGSDGAALLRAADVAMHLAKQRAGATVVAFEPGMAARSGQLLEIEQALAAAIEQEEFLLEYQPKYASGSRTLAGFEALVRWQRPGRGRVSPAEFIPAAERTGQIGPLGTLILRLAARQLRQWQEQHGRVLPTAINVSPLQFEDPGFAAGLLAMVRAHGLAPELIDIEITETAAITHMDRVLPQLARLREAGVGVAFDDFGTGQSSLTLLRRLPITTLKLDRSMIDPLPEASAGAVVRAACVLAEALGLAVVAEGVETEAQAAAAEGLGCTHLQGYLLSRPLAADAAGALLSAP